MRFNKIPEICSIFNFDETALRVPTAIFGDSA